jgi:hypothetical protein
MEGRGRALAFSEAASGTHEVIGAFELLLFSLFVDKFLCPYLWFSFILLAEPALGSFAFCY